MTKRAAKPIKIVFDASPLLVNKTGVAYYTEQLVTQLADRYPNDVELVGFYYNFLGRRDSGHLPKKANLHYRQVSLIPSKIIYQLRRWGIEIPVELLSHTRADFILFPNFLGYPSLMRTPSAPVVHDLTYLDLPEYVSAKNRHDLERFVPKQIKRSRFVITVSEFSKQKISKAYGTQPSDVIVTPIPPVAPTLHDKQTRDATLEKLGITEPYILFLSTIEPRKNILGLLAAYRQLPETQQKQYALVIAGRVGWHCDAELAAIQQAQQDGLNVIHVGYVDDTARSILYQSATLFTTASHYEGFGMPVLEAMSYGIPCAVSDIPVFKEVADDAAVYFDQEEHAAIATALQAVLQDPTRLTDLATRGKKRADSFHWDTVARTVYEAITANIQAQ